MLNDFTLEVREEVCTDNNDRVIDIELTSNSKFDLRFVNFHSEYTLSGWQHRGSIHADFDPQEREEILGIIERNSVIHKEDMVDYMRIVRPKNFTPINSGRSNRPRRKRRRSNV